MYSLQTGRHSLKFGGDIRYLQLDNQAAFNTKGSFTFNNLQDYVNNFANQFTQALQISSFDATADAAVLLRAGRLQADART